MTEENPFPALPSEHTIGDAYGAALKLTAAQAPFYFERLVEWQMTHRGATREQAEIDGLANLTYYAEYSGEDVKTHVREIFSMANPAMAAFKLGFAIGGRSTNGPGAKTFDA